MYGPRLGASAQYVLGVLGFQVDATSQGYDLSSPYVDNGRDYTVNKFVRGLPTDVFTLWGMADQESTWLVGRASRHVNTCLICEVCLVPFQLKPKVLGGGLRPLGRALNAQSDSSSLRLKVCYSAGNVTRDKSGDVPIQPLSSSCISNSKSSPCPVPDMMASSKRQWHDREDTSPRPFGKLAG